MQMAADLPENYQGHPAFKFIRDVAVDWDTTVVLDGRIGDYVAVARKTRGQDEWFLGAITDEEARTLEVPLSFLPAGRRYVAEIYADNERSHWLTAPLEYQVLEQPVDASTRVTLRLAAGGGVAVRISRRP
jgi:alpha-glucosidase